MRPRPSRPQTEADSKRDKVLEPPAEGKRDPEMSKPPTAPPPTIVPASSSAKLPAVLPAKGSADDSEPQLTKGEKHIRVLVEELYRSGLEEHNEGIDPKWPKLATALSNEAGRHKHAHPLLPKGPMRPTLSSETPNSTLQQLVSWKM